MARTRDAAAHAVKRDAFLDAAAQLMQRKGFQAMTIADVLESTGASKGAFYHYFSSKQDLLDGVVQRMLDQIVGAVRPIVDAEDLTALEKLDRYFAAIGQWKNARRELVLATARAWASDANALPRLKLRLAAGDKSGRLLARVVRQGIAEGQFAPCAPEATGRLIYAIIQDLQDTLMSTFATDDPPHEDPESVRVRFEAYADALERLLGAPPGTIRLIDDDTFDEWFRR
ncbi:MAG TPA: TetR/AcrR family transcriptional regulator [Stackebrandtia sp.]|nr:TetR/AcrR family transcriptional regulator [Stackebrandtia sp.]